MKIFIFTNIFPEKNYIGGAEIQAYILAKYLSNLGHLINYVALKGAEGLNGKKVENFQVNYLSSETKNIKTSLANLNILIQDKKPDLIFIRNFHYLYLLNRVCKKNNVPIIYNTTHIDNCHPFLGKIKFGLNYHTTLGSIKAAVFHYLNFRTLKKINVITINKSHADILKQKLNILATPIYNSMEDNYEKNKIPKENIVAWIANIKIRKQPEVFIKLANELKNSGYKFIMIGYLQNNVKYYQDLIYEEEKVNKNFKYLGGIPDEKEVDKILAKCKILVHTCLPEGFGNNFIQAWLNECPTVSLKFDADDIMVKNRIGFHSGTYLQLVKDVKYLIDNPKMTAEMGKKARQYALANHLPENNVLNYEKYFKEVINKHAKKDK